MSIERVYSPGWGVGEKLTSAQMNAHDLALTYAVDKRAGYTDALMSLVVATGAGRLVSTVATGPDATATFFAGGGNQIVRIPTLTAARTYALGTSGATGGDRMIFYVEGTGATASGYVDIVNHVGTALVKIGQLRSTSPNAVAASDSAELHFVATGWQLLRLGGASSARVVEFTSTSDWVCPPGVNEVLIEAWGGGGGGGAGISFAFDGSYPGGGGGGGAVPYTVRVPVVPGTTYSIVIGAGGTCAAENVRGSDGGDTIFGCGATALAIFPGAAGGGVGTLIENATVPAPTMIHVFAAAGASIRPGTGLPNSSGLLSAPQALFGGSGAGALIGYIADLTRTPGRGGFGTTSTVPTMSRYNFGAPSSRGWPGGAPGRWGTGFTGYSQAYFSGGGGGGGGGGPAGGGATGGAGGNASHNGGATASTSGLTPNHAPPNSGAGGGGGGAAGGVGGVTADGAIGSNGGSGKLSIVI